MRDNGETDGINVETYFKEIGTFLSDSTKAAGSLFELEDGQHGDVDPHGGIGRSRRP